MMILRNISSLLVSSSNAIISASNDDILPKDEWCRSLVFKVITDKTLRVPGLREMICKSWKIKDSAVTEFGSSSFMVRFPSSFDRDQICGKGPWLFENGLLVLHKAEPNVQPEDYQFTTTNVWVHLIGLPVAYLNVNVVKKVASALGTPYELAKNEDQKWSYIKLGSKVSSPPKIDQGLHPASPVDELQNPDSSTSLAPHAGDVENTQLSLGAEKVVDWGLTYNLSHAGLGGGGSLVPSMDVAPNSKLSQSNCCKTTLFLDSSLEAVEISNDCSRPPVVADVGSRIVSDPNAQVSTSDVPRLMKQTRVGPPSDVLDLDEMAVVAGPNLPHQEP
uniref:DUF4283 domain-containing protein n=1 Tax=Nelumbo nucifera TaxID=4432 RepID=A0A822ZLM5_NELNU|nr:TPA_asm: hypothetical protein HUJ06_003883 [Nelumbo nucifera]